jgi:hypothetical protein
MRLFLAVLAAGAIAGGVSHAQQIVSAHAGVVHYTEGHVFLNDQAVQQKFGVFPDLQVDQVLRTEDGRAEVLLTPGAFLRLSENSSVRMLSRDLSDTRFEVLGGSVMVECDDLAKGTALTVVYKGNNIQLERHGLYRLDAGDSRFSVYDGRAVVESSSGQLALGKGKEANLNGVLVAGKFNPSPKLGDDFYAWNGMRSGYLATANVSAAQSLYSSGTRWQSSGWMYDPWYGAYTFIPAGGVFFNPFGWGFWSPGLVMYAPVGYGYGYGGYGYGPGGYGGRPTLGSGGGGTSVSRAPAAGSRPGGFGGGSRGFSGGGGGFSGGGMSHATGGGGFGGGGGGHAGGGGGGGHR